MFWGGDSSLVVSGDVIYTLTQIHRIVLFVTNGILWWIKGINHKDFKMLKNPKGLEVVTIDQVHRYCFSSMICGGVQKPFGF